MSDEADRGAMNCGRLRLRRGEAAPRLARLPEARGHRNAAVTLSGQQWKEGRAARRHAEAMRKSPSWQAEQRRQQSNKQPTPKVHTQTISFQLHHHSLVPANLPALSRSHAAELCVL